MKNKVIMALALTVTLLVGAMIGGCESNIAEAETQRINFEQIGRYGYFLRIQRYRNRSALFDDIRRQYVS